MSKSGAKTAIASLFLLLNVIDNANDSVRMGRPPVDHCVDTDRDAVAGKDLWGKVLVIQLKNSILQRFGGTERRGLCLTPLRCVSFCCVDSGLRWSRFN